MKDPIEMIRHLIDEYAGVMRVPDANKFSAALAELERRAKIEERLVRWLNGGRRMYKRRPDLGHVLEDYRTATLYMADTLEAALDAAGAP